MSHWQRSFPPSQVDCTNHTWITYVLEDLSDYCSNYKLAALQKELEVLRMRLLENDLLKTEACKELELLH